MSRSENVQDSNRYVVSGQHDGSILPSRHADIGRSVFLNSGAAVSGGILCGSIIVDGDVTVRDAIYARGEIHISSSDAAPRFGSSISSSVAIQTSGSTDERNVVFGADVMSPTVSLRSSIVFGNVFGGRVLLTDCAVIGAVHAREDLILRRCLIGTFSAGKVQLDGHVRMVLPTAYAFAPIVLSHPVSCLMFENLGRLIQRTSDDVCGYLFTPTDIRQMWYPTNANSERIPHWVLSLATRIANAARSRDIIQQNREFIRTIAMRELIHHSERRAIGLSQDQLESGLMRLATASIPS